MPLTCARFLAGLGGSLAYVGIRIWLPVTFLAHLAAYNPVLNVVPTVCRSRVPFVYIFAEEEPPPRTSTELRRSRA